ncbi:MAG TPA: glycosyltransferase family 39 protein, partial [Isosphaeraceae bacterium]|nr:glycosyltransferase family 39 protein [Isosphaeraceae bacterium]
MVRGWALGEERKTTWTWLTKPWRFSLSSETFTWLAVVLGIILRMIEYKDNRQLYMDEKSLLENLVGRPLFDFHTILTEEQLAPPGFLVIERMMVRLPLEIKLAGRLVPFVCGLVSMFLFRSVGRRYLTTRAVPIAVGLFALADWMLYYSVEMKQYSGDVALTLVALLLAARPASGSEGWPAELSRRWLLALASLGVIGVWFSYPLALVLAGVGTYLIAEAALRRDWKKALALVAMSVVWALSFTVCYKVSHRILSKGRFIWDWWDFAFLPLPPHSVAELKQELWQLINVTNNPASVFTPMGVIPSAFLAAGLFLLGGLVLGRRWRGGLYLLLAPL